MKRLYVTAILIFIAAGLLIAGGTAGWILHRLIGPEPAVSKALAQSQLEARVLSRLDEMRRTGGVRFGVPENDGRRLRLLVEATGAREVIEVGTSTGYSTLWLCLGVHETGGHVTTFELDERIAAIARDNIRKAGVEQYATVVVGNAHTTLVAFDKPVDLVFLDADKEGYVDYLEKLLPRLRPGGLMLAHNVEYAPEYTKRVTADAALDTVRLTQASGLSATLKKRTVAAE